MVKLVKKLITNLDSSKISALDCIPVVVLKNCEPKLSDILDELFSMCPKEYFFQIVARSHLLSMHLKMLGRGILLKTAALLFFEKLVNNRLVEKCGLFSDLQYSFRSFGSITDLLTVVSEWIAGAFSRSDISMAFNRVWLAGFFCKLLFLWNFRSSIWTYLIFFHW